MLLLFKTADNSEDPAAAMRIQVSEHLEGPAASRPGRQGTLSLTSCQSIIRIAHSAEALFDGLRRANCADDDAQDQWPDSKGEGEGECDKPYIDWHLPPWAWPVLDWSTCEVHV